MSSPSEEEFPAVATFVIRHRRYLAPDGEVVQALPEHLAEPAALVPLYRAMLMTRAFDAKCVALNRTGRLGTFATAYGQEAVPVGIASAMRADDVLVPSYRENGAMLWRGVTVTELLSYWSGSERGSNWSGPREDFPVSITVGGHPLHAAGVASAIMLRGQRRGVVCVFGDAATSKGDVYEAMNLAGVWCLPLVFVITNNRWAISTPLARQTAAQTLAQKGIAAGIACDQVDGNDVVAVHEAVRLALERAYAGGGATLVEAVTYRLADHNTADDSTRYRDPAEVEPHRVAEPLRRVRAYLEAFQAWGEAEQEACERECAERLEAGVAEMLAMHPEGRGAMFDNVYAALPADLARQREEAVENGHG